METVFELGAKKTTGKSSVIKPSLLAYPKTWFWMITINLAATSSDSGAFKAIVFIMYFLLPLLVLIMITKGRSYILQGNTITKVNHLSGDREAISTLNIQKVQIKPSVFGCGNVILTLADGSTFNIKNIKLPSRRRIHHSRYGISEWA